MEFCKLGEFFKQAHSNHPESEEQVAPWFEKIRRSPPQVNCLATMDVIPG
jgi:hypothetical protein